MPCYHPVPAFMTASGEVVFVQLGRYDIVGDIKLPCRQCIGCRLSRASEWTLRVMHEASLYPENAFLTLTYDDAHIPPDRSLRYSDFQKFMKRLRKHARPSEVRFYMCGEYGEDLSRPHYHVCLFNYRFSDLIPTGRSDSGEILYTSKILEKLWSHGIVTQQDLTYQSAGYTARYCTKKITGDLAEAHYSGREPEFNRMSNRPGIGAHWFDRYRADVFPHDYVVSQARKQPVPGYYDKLLKRADPDEFETVAQTRQRSVLALKEDNTPERKLVKEIVHTARVRNLKRKFN